MPKRLIAEADDIALKVWADKGPDRDIPDGGVRATQVLFTEGLAAKSAAELELVGVQAAATRPALELLASVARFVLDGGTLSDGEQLNLGLATIALSAGDAGRLRVTDQDWPGSGRVVAASAVRLLNLLCEDLGFAMLREGGAEDAGRLFEAAAELDPKSVTARMGEAFSWRDQKRPDKAEQYFTAALLVADTVNLDEKRRGLIHLERARCFREQAASAGPGAAEARKTALSDFAEARRRDPANAEAPYEQAHLLFALGDDTAAKQALASLKQLIPGLDAQAAEDAARQSVAPELHTIPGYPEDGNGEMGGGAGGLRAGL